MHERTSRCSHTDQHKRRSRLQLSMYMYNYNHITSTGRVGLFSNHVRGQIERELREVFHIKLRKSAINRDKGTEDSTTWHAIQQTLGMSFSIWMNLEPLPCFEFQFMSPYHVACFKVTNHVTEFAPCVFGHLTSCTHTVYTESITVFPAKLN